MHKRQYTFHLYATERIKEKRQAGQHNTADLYRTTRNWVRRFTQGKDLRLAAITPSFIASFSTFLKSEGLMSNSVHTYLSNFRAIYHQACRNGLIPRKSISPFDGLMPRKERGRSRALRENELLEIVASRPERPDQKKAIDLGTFSLLACGMPFADLAHLTIENIQGSEIVYRRKKTGALIRIEITSAMWRLIKKYVSPSTRYLFPILPEGRMVGHEEYKALLRSYNRSLKEIGRSLPNPVRLTSYTFRHSWATNAYRKHVPLSIISQALGHASEQTTRYYLAALDQSELNLANKRVIGEIERLLATG